MEHGDADLLSRLKPEVLLVVDERRWWGLEHQRGDRRAHLSFPAPCTAALPASTTLTGCLSRVSLVCPKVLCELLVQVASSNEPGEQSLCRSRLFLCSIPAHNECTAAPLWSASLRGLDGGIYHPRHSAATAAATQT